LPFRLYLKSSGRVLIKNYSDKWSWEKYYKKNINWEDGRILDLLVESGNKRNWIDISKTLPVKYIEEHLEKYQEYWDWRVVSNRVSNEFIIKHVINTTCKWDFDELSKRETSTVKQLILQVISFNSQNHENLINADWDYYSLTDSFDDDFILRLLPYNPSFNFSSLSQRSPDFVVTLINEYNHLSSAQTSIKTNFHSLSWWNWEHIIDNWDLKFIWENISVYEDKIDWHLLLIKVFSKEKSKTLFIHHNLLDKYLKKHSGQIDKFRNENLLWDTELIKYLDSYDLLEWGGYCGFECNPHVNWLDGLIYEYADKFSTDSGKKFISKLIDSPSYLNNLPEIKWDWNLIISNDKIPFDSNLLNDFKDHWDWSQLSKELPENLILESIGTEKFPWDFYELSKREASFISTAILEKKALNIYWDWPCLVNKLELQDALMIITLASNYSVFHNNVFLTFSKTLTRRVPFDFIFSNLENLGEFWDWTYLTRSLPKETVLANLNELSNYWDWELLTKSILSLDEVLSHLVIGKSLWDWAYLIEVKLPNELLTEENFFTTVVNFINQIPEAERRHETWHKLTKRLPPEFLKQKIYESLNNSELNFDWEILSSYHFDYTKNFVDDFKEKWIWSVLSRNTKINWKWDYLKQL
jgi:hypothetical protein